MISINKLSKYLLSLYCCVSKSKLSCGIKLNRLLCVALLTLALPACVSVVKLNPDMAMPSSGKINIEDARGPLSNAQTKAIIAKLKQASDGDDIVGRHLLVEQAIGDTPLVAGNHVTLLKNGPPTYKSMFATIASATSTINLETFTFEPDDIGQRLLDALTEKQRSGIQVNIIYDSIGSINTSKAFFEKFTQAGGRVVEYNPINPLKAKVGWDLNERDHRKLLVVDGKIAYVGGVNISSVYTSNAFRRFSSYDRYEDIKENKKRAQYEREATPEPDSNSLIDKTPENTPAKKQPEEPPITWRDTHVMIEGPVVANFQDLFMKSWNNQKGPELGREGYYPELRNVGNDIIRAIGSTPNDPYNLIYDTLISAINSAEDHVWITNAYFIPDINLITALKDAAARGVDVRILLPSTTDSSLVLNASRSYFDELLAAGIKIYERQDVMLHAKTALIDGVWSTVGSSNLDWRSFIYNQEINAVILGADFGQQMQVMYEEDLKVSKEIKLEEWRKRSLLSRIKEKGSRVWAKYL